MILEAEEDLEVVGEEADDVEAVTTTTAALRPDVVLMDVWMPRLDGLAAASRTFLADLVVKVVMLMTFNEDNCVHRVWRSGASGFVLKVAPAKRLVETVRGHACRIRS